MSISVGGSATGSIFITGERNVIHLGEGREGDRRPPDVRMLTVIAAPLADKSGQEPPRHSPLNVWMEWERLSKAFPRGANWEVAAHHPATEAWLGRRLSRAANLQRPFAILHFVGHGGAQGLIIEDELGRERLLDVEALGALLKAGDVRLLVLNACETLPLAETMIAHGYVEAAIATERTVDDRTAITFARQLYERLAAGDGVGQAFRRASRGIERSLYRLVGDESLHFPASEGRLRLRRYPLPNVGLRWGMARHFVGRREAMVRLGRWLLEGKATAFALHGVGGIGKTALATAAALRYAPLGGFHALLFVSADEEPALPPSLVLRALWMAYGIEPHSLLDERVAAQEALRILNERPTLLILDNLESLDEASSRRLLRFVEGVDGQSGTRLLMTLRPDEKEPLTRWVGGRYRLHLERMERGEAMRLLAERMGDELESELLRKRLQAMAAEALREGLSSPRKEAEWRALAQHYHLPADWGLPLGWGAEKAFDYPGLLRMVAAQLRTYRWDEVSNRLRVLRGKPAERLEQFIGRMVTELERRAPQAKALLCAMLPFRGGAPAWALRRIVAVEEPPEAEDFRLGGNTPWLEEGEEAEEAAMSFRDEIIQPALESGLLRSEEAVEGNRYWLEPFVRHYLERRRCGSEAERRRYALRHAKLFLPVAAAVEAALMRGAVSLAAPPEWENLAAAFTFLAEGAEGEEEDGLLIAYLQAMPNLLSLTSALPAERKLAWLTAAQAAAARQGEETAKALALLEQGEVLYRQAEMEEALERYEGALVLYRAVGDRLGEANTLRALGEVLAFQKRNKEALERYEGALALYRAVGDRLGEANTLRGMGQLALAAGAVEAALHTLDQAVELHHAIGDAYSEAGDRYYRAKAFLAQGKVEDALEDLRFAEAVFRQLALPYADAIAQLRQQLEGQVRNR